MRGTPQHEPQGAMSKRSRSSEEPEEPDAEEEEEEEGESSDEEKIQEGLFDSVFDLFDSHISDVVKLQERRQKDLEFKVDTERDAHGVEAKRETLDEIEQLGVWVEGDTLQGDCNMRTLKKLLARIDARGYERSAQQLEFHESFMKATARVIYRADWEVSRPAIMKKYGWTKANSEVLISTPRRFGKTFRYETHALNCTEAYDALVCAASQFSSRASRWRSGSRPLSSVRPVGRVASCSREWVRARPVAPCRRAHFGPRTCAVEFIRLAGGEDRIIEFNQEACRVRAFDGRNSLIRSFPCVALASAHRMHMC